MKWRCLASRPVRAMIGHWRFVGSSHTEDCVAHFVPPCVFIFLYQFLSVCLTANIHRSFAIQYAVTSRDHGLPKQVHETSFHTVLRVTKSAKVRVEENGLVDP